MLEIARWECSELIRILTVTRRILRNYGTVQSQHSLDALPAMERLRPIKRDHGESAKNAIIGGQVIEGLQKMYSFYSDRRNHGIPHKVSTRKAHAPLKNIILQEGMVDRSTDP